MGLLEIDSSSYAEDGFPKSTVPRLDALLAFWHEVEGSTKDQKDDKDAKLTDKDLDDHVLEVYFL